MLDVWEYIKERENYILYDAKRDDWIDEINSSELQDEVFFITSEGFLYMQNMNQRDDLFKRYHLAGVFDLGALYTSAGVKWALIHVVSQNVPTVRIAVFNGEVYNKKKNKSDWSRPGFRAPKEYLPQFINYIKKLEDWVNNGIFPEPDAEGHSEFNTVSSKDIDIGKIYPDYYTKKAMEVKEIAQKEKFSKLSDVADVIMSGTLKDHEETVKILKPSDFSYPLDINSLSEGTPTKVELQKGDIVFPTVGTKGIYLYNLDSEESVYASPTEAVIRCKDILPEYLFFYLNSDVATQLYNIVSQGTVMKRISIRDLRDFPVAKPKEDGEKYIDDFKTISTVGKMHYEQKKRVQSYYERLKVLSEKEKEPEHIEDILNIEIAQNIKAHDEEQLRSFLTNDLNELNICFKHGAYKATLILAGSILEAVLIDWVSDVHDTNYFEEDYFVIDRRTGREKRADLIDYIDEIEELERPQWMEEASKAHEIRKKRNLVHAKLCMNADVDINEETCREVIGYLRDVIRTRGVSYTPDAR